MRGLIILMMRRYRARHLKPKPKRRGPVVVATAASMSLAGPAHAATHLVRKGETLSDIARRHGSSVARLARINRLSDPNLIVAGSRLRVPGRARITSIHVVRQGETLSGIAARYRSTVARLTRVNRLGDPNLIVVGTRLKVPHAASPVRARSVTSRSAIAASLHSQAVAHGVDPALVKAVAWQESGWQQHVKSSAGAIGVMQVMPGTARYVNRVLGGGGDHRLKIRKADDNVHLGVMYLRHMLGIFKTRRKALAGYYSGPGNVGRRLKKYQRPYVRSVMALTRRFR